MKILLKMPSRGRPDKLISILQQYLEYAADKDNIYILISLDSDDPTVSSDLLLKLYKLHDKMGIHVGKSGGKIFACNRDMEYADIWDILVLASDDMHPEVRGWDSILRYEMQRLYPDLDGVLWFSDGFQKEKLDTMCILGKKYYDRFGYIYHPSYKSIFCDNEFTLVASHLNKISYSPQILFRHMHPYFGNAFVDETYIENEKYNTEDALTFEIRRAQGFP